MLLKSLELQGFKTFPDKTRLTFHNGITAVVGPNGSGKSNISDAVRWVLGEQSIRTLRCTKMEDVIFGGTPERKPLGFAEVTLNIDNSDRALSFDSDVVSVTRRYYRSGESEYLINNATVRLRDVTELFLDTGLGRDGYSMIGQGKIDSIVAARSEDRREVFEEAAGVSRFRFRKEESERRLAQAEENLLRLHDILSELESRVGPLKEQAEKAKQYLELAAEKKSLEIGLWLSTLDQSGRVLREQDDKIAIAKAQYDAAEAEIGALEKEIEQTFQDSNACAAKADEVRNARTELEAEAARKDGEISVLKNEIRHSGENAERLRGEIAQNSLSEEELQKEIAEKKKTRDERLAAAAEMDARFADTSASLGTLKSGMDETDERIRSASLKIAELTARAAEVKAREMSAVSTIAEISLRVDALARSTEEKQKSREILKQSAENFRRELSEADAKIQSLGNTVKGYQMRTESRAAKREAARQKSDALRLDLQEQLRRAKLLEDLERNLEGFSQSVKAVMKESGMGALSGVHGPVSRVVKVPEQYAVAMETALGAAMQDVVVDTEQDAKRAIAFLKRTNGGRATFLPIATIRGKTLQENGLEQCRGFVGIASGLCTFEDTYRGIVESLLGRIAVAEDLDCAAAIAGKYGYRFRVVTLDGQVVNAGGSFTGGSLARNSGLLSRASEIEKIRREAENTRQASEASAAAFKAAAEDASAAEAQLAGAKGELASAQEDRARLEAEARHTEAELASAEKDLSVFREENAAADERLKNQKEVGESARKQSEEITAQIQQRKDELAGITGNREELNRRCDELAEEIRKLELDRLAARKDAQSLDDIIREAEARGQDHLKKMESLKADIAAEQKSSEELERKVQQLSVEAEKLREDAKAQDAEIAAITEKRMQFEQKAVGLRAGEREKTGEKEKIGHDLALLEERRENLQKEYDGIISQLWEEYELTRREAEEQAGERIADPAKAKRRLNAVKNSIRDLGTVNVGAVEEYRQVSGRYEFLKTQVADAEQSRDALVKLIGSLTRQMKDLFSARFAVINRNFGETFRDLFGGGSAQLSLTDPENVLESGIEISVQPPGKIVAHLEALSGGEKALVAIALYFAIMKVNPPPFCVLDEIEAALDDVNVARFAAYLRGMTDRTQFIVITHRRGSMEEADVLYGVTMQDEGVSKLLEMPVAQMEAQLGIKA